MSDQRTFASVPYDSRGEATRRERVLQEMDRVIPRGTLFAIILPHYATAGRGRRPLPLETTLRVCFLQQWFELSDPQAEDMLYDSESLRRFARVALGEDTVPDESTILRFRHLLEQHELTLPIFDAVRDLLADQRLLRTAGTIVDATIIAAPSATKNATTTRDPEMKQTRIGNQWYVGLKVHVGTDTRGLVHTLTTTDAAVADSTHLDDLLHGQASTLDGDKAYGTAEDQAQWDASGGTYGINRRGKRTALWDRSNAARSKVRARCEHVVLVVKRLWGFTTVRHRGLAKHRVRAAAAFALANLSLVRHKLRPQGPSAGASGAGGAKRPAFGAKPRPTAHKRPSFRRRRRFHARFRSERCAAINLCTASLKETPTVLSPGEDGCFGRIIRMHESRKYGSADAWNGLFDATNVLTCDDSCFPAGPEKIITLTVMEIAARAADRLARDLKQQATVMAGGRR